MSAKVGVSEEDGLQEACGVFGCVAAGKWPTELNISQIICLGLVGLQHRYVHLLFKFQPSNTGLGLGGGWPGGGCGEGGGGGG